MLFAVDDELAPASYGNEAPLVKTLDELIGITSEFASSDAWSDRVRLRTDRRWYERLHQNSEYDVWLISWMPGQSTGFHDHGKSSGAFTVVTGTLEEHRPGTQEALIRPGQTRAFSEGYAHDVANRSLGPAVSIHVYSPPLTEMNEYELAGEELVPLDRMSEKNGWSGHRSRAGLGNNSDKSGLVGVDQMLASARARLRRLSPLDAYEELTQSDAVLVDIRPEAQRANEGAIPGAVIIERNVLEWRLDPTSDARLSFAGDYDLQIIVLCSEGYTSSLAAASLQDLGLWRATDIIGGYQAWNDASLPVDLSGTS